MNGDLIAVRRSVLADHANVTDMAALDRALATLPPGADRISAIVGEVLAELIRATDKFPTWPTDPLHAVAVLGEESGELTRAVMQAVYEPHKGGPSEVREEAIQTAAMAIRFLLSMPEYEYAPAAQHEQQAGA